MKTTRLVLGYLRHNLMSAMAYRGAFFLQVFGMMLNNAMLLFFWWVLFNQLPSLRGWTLEHVMTLYALIALGFGLAHIFCGNGFRLAQIITRGELDYYLALPANPLLHLLVSRSSLPAWGDALFGLILYFFAVPGPWARLPLFVLLTVLTAFIYIAFAVLVGSLAFWVGNADNLAAQTVNALLTFGLYPIEIFPGPAQLLLYTLIPAAFVGSVPAGLLREFRPEMLGLLLAVTIAITLLAGGVFYRGLRRYESGNLVIVRA
ncbi:MAG: ABC-2 family transporter protein [Chloroflexia bacterium]|nr:ABC-2 family transporter protein [Chloroflexia bacterium]